jgi:uncharacterized protein
MATLLGMFAKVWTPGAVKTRLAASLGPARAAAIHRLFVETLIARFGQTADQRMIAFAPQEAEAAVRDIAGNRWQLTSQTEGDLGRRIEAFFEQMLAQYGPVVLIGSDSPDLPLEVVEQAFAALESCDVVLGPAQDGGYYLVAAARSVPLIFAGIAWGTDQVWPQTMAQLQAADCRWHELPGWYDVDDEQGLRALLIRLAHAKHRDEHLANLDDRLRDLLSE